MLAEFRAFRAREVETVLQEMSLSQLAALAEGLEAFQAAAANLGLAVEASGQERSADIAQSLPHTG